MKDRRRPDSPSCDSVYFSVGKLFVGAGRGAPACRAGRFPAAGALTAPEPPESGALYAYRTARGLKSVSTSPKRTWQPCPNMGEGQGWPLLNLSRRRNNQSLDSHRI